MVVCAHLLGSCMFGFDALSAGHEAQSVDNLCIIADSCQLQYCTAQEDSLILPCVCMSVAHVAASRRLVSCCKVTYPS